MISYDRHPYVEVTADASACTAGWERIGGVLRERVRPGRFTICVECYPGVLVDEIAAHVERLLLPSLMVHSTAALREEREIDRMLAPVLTEDPVFGRMNGCVLADFLAREKVGALRAAISAAEGLVVVVGPGASLIVPECDLLVYAGLARWEIQQRQRQNRIGNLGAGNLQADAGAKYKRAFFVDWRAADRLKQSLYDRISFYLDTNDTAHPKMISGEWYRRGLEMVVRRPFRVVPFFDPGPWGGFWMKERFGLPDGPPNYAWCFDCVPEENSLLLGFGEHRVEIPAIDIVLRHPRELLGRAVHERFGAEFPIRFDLLDTMGGGNLSLQVHPLTAYIREQFGMTYTQDESYYLLDRGEGAVVYLGLKEGADKGAMIRDLRAAQSGKSRFRAERYVNVWPASKHDHFLIPGGTIHCSGRNCLVLEISATPYIFTFKLWDWDRLGLDGRPRPIHLDHGIANLQWDRTTDWVKRELLARPVPVAAGDGWREERTGLHALEFIETRRHWFSGTVPHDTEGNLNVLNLVEGEAAVVESPDRAFAPFAVHYAETFIVPAAVGAYTIRPLAPSCGTIKAFVRSGNAG